ncbi:TonB family protein [Luteimonas sp. MC1750]|uniref:TonB family protein n=1 Tax=Luteimonas sp. MC1750 TaxID=2799326 RepID=UPI0018F0F6E0|nr:TonB family protein [Luteimonas sp. MC1750]MBJ6983915.1 TonB family protein [Luteimonas sp. MC1750]QQO06733.1 TonB family protein [Luteimonas sp. MC1750]
MQRTTNFLLLGLALPCAAFASGADLATQQVYTYAVDLGVDGRVAEVSPHGPVSGAVGDVLVREARGWVFNPGASGDAAGTRTYLRVVVDESADGSWRVVSATTGPALAAMTPPAYPVRDQLAGNEGMVVLRLEVAADGSVRDAGVHAATGTVSRTMARAAEAASRAWRFSPEQVAGKAVPSTLLWPVCYLGPASSVSACSWTGPDALRFSSKTVLPLDPTVTVTWTAAR